MTKKPAIPIPVLVAIVVLALAAVAWQVGGSMGSSRQVEQAQDTNKWISDLAIRTGGDASKLTPEERKKMDELTSGETEIVLRNQMQMGAPAK